MTLNVVLILVVMTIAGAQKSQANDHESMPCSPDSSVLASPFYEPNLNNLPILKPWLNKGVRTNQGPIVRLCTKYSHCRNQSETFMHKIQLDLYLTQQLERRQRLVGEFHPERDKNVQELEADLNQLRLSFPEAKPIPTLNKYLLNETDAALEATSNKPAGVGYYRRNELDKAQPSAHWLNSPGDFGRTDHQRIKEMLEQRAGMTKYK